MRRFGLTAFLLFTTCDGPPDQCGAWLQWGGNPAHVGESCATAEPMARQLAELKFDPFVEAEEADAQGEILVHYQVPLIAGDDVYAETKSGQYTPCDPPVPPSMTPVCRPYRLNSQTWNETALRFENGQLVRKWSVASDWKPEPYPGFEPMFQPAVAGDKLWMPGGGGSVFLVDRPSGALLQRVKPFPTLDPDLYVASPITADAAGNIYYTALKLDHDNPWTADAHGWLVRVTADGSPQTVPFESLVPGAPAATDLCRGTFDFMNDALPWPPPPNPDGSPATPMSAPCGTQRPGINAAPAIGPDGTIFVVSTAQLNSRWSYVVAVNPDLTPRWATSLRGYLSDGCGVTLPSDGVDEMTNPGDCRMGALMGVDPSTNETPAARVIDDSSSSPVALPDGGVIYGAYTGYNDYRGHLLKLDKDGHLVASYDFGWDTTPALWQHDRTYSIVLKDNHYTYDPMTGVDAGPYYITQLDPNLHIEWQFLSTNTQSCQRLDDGQLACTPDHPHGFEWCINAPAVDRDGTVYVNSEDGNLYAIAQGGTEKQHIFLDMSVGAAYTPLSIDGFGRIYTLNNGRLSVVGK